jgi:Trypsin-like peptidase domain
MRLRRVAAWMPAFFLLASVVDTANSQTPQEVARKLFPKTLVLTMEGADGRPMSLGSGFVIGPGIVATNRHVLEGAVRGFGKYVGTAERLEIDGVLAESAEHDLALVKIAAASSAPVELGNSDVVEIGETVYAVGSPIGLEGTFSNGIVSGFRDVGRERLIQITAPISPGSSGGPIANGKGLVIGVAVATLKDGQNLNFAVPSNYLSRLRGSAGPAKALATIGNSPRAIGVPLTDGVLAHSFTWKNASSGLFGISLENKLRDPVGNVSCIVIFYDENGRALDSAKVWISGSSASNISRIEPGAAVRVIGVVDPDVVRLAGFVPRQVFGNDIHHRRDAEDPDGLVHQFPESWTSAQIHTYMSDYWEKRKKRTRIRILTFEVLR